MDNLQKIAVKALKDTKIIADVFGQDWTEGDMWSQVDKTICQMLNCESTEQTREASIRVVSPTIYGSIYEMK